MQRHIDYIKENLGYASPHTLAEEGLDVKALELIGDDWQFDPEDDYCPVTFGGGLVPEDVTGKGCGLHFSSDGKLYIVGDNGQCAFYYRLSRVSN